MCRPSCLPNIYIVFLVEFYDEEYTLRREAICFACIKDKERHSRLPADHVLHVCDLSAAARRFAWTSHLKLFGSVAVLDTARRRAAVKRCFSAATWSRSRGEAGRNHAVAVPTAGRRRQGCFNGGGGTGVVRRGAPVCARRLAGRGAGVPVPQRAGLPRRRVRGHGAGV